MIVDDSRNRQRFDAPIRTRDSIVFSTVQPIGMGSQPPPGIIFNLPLNDLGAGAVNTAPSFSIGSATATFTRANVAWAKLSTGLWTQVATGTARSHYLGADTTVGAYGGYLSELTAIQLVTPTASIRDMTDASWIAVTCTKAKTATGIDGVGNSASTLTATGATATVLQTLVAAATSRTFSAFVKRRTGTGTVFIQQGATQVDITALINSSTYTRVSVTASVLNAAFGFQINTSADAIDVDFNQFEAGANATSPIDNAGTRAGDVLTYVGTGNIVTALGSCYCEYSSMMVSLDANPLGITASGPIIRLFATETLMQDTSGLRHFPAIVPVNSGAITKISARWSDSASSANVVQSGTIGTPTPWASNWTLTAIGIGCATNNSQQPNGTIKNVKIYNAALTDSALQVLTT